MTNEHCTLSYTIYQNLKLFSVKKAMWVMLVGFGCNILCIIWYKIQYIKSSLKIITENNFNICPCFVTMKLDLSNGLLMSKSYQIITRTYSWHIFWRELVGRITNQKTGFSNGSVANYDALNRLHIESSKYLKTHYKHKRC